MGEGKRDQSTKRHRLCGLGKSVSDSELTRTKLKAKEKWPFLEGLTVDELARYRRRRIQGHPKDSLCKTEGSLKNIVTEYRRAYDASNDVFKENILPTRREQPEDISKIQNNFLTADGGRTMETETESSKFIAHLNPVGRPALMRRGTTLNHNGDFHSDTENALYVAHQGHHRAELARRPTSLKMEGQMDTMTEKCEKFIEWLNVSRPELMRLPTHLKLEGDFETVTENHEKYVPFVGARRPEILRQNANLKMEGESRHVAEYTDVFKDYDVREKRGIKKPETHLKAEGDFYQTTETSEKFVNPRIREMQLSAQLQRDIAEEEEKWKHDDGMKTLVSGLEDSKGSPLGIPEYKDAFKDFPRSRPTLMRPEDEIGRADGSKISSSPTNSKFQTKIDMDPEYKSKFLDHSKERPVYRKPPMALRPSASEKFGRAPTGQQASRVSNVEPTSEVRSQYVSYGQIPRVETIKMPANLRLEGNIDLQPEYRNAYCSERENHDYGEPRMHRRRDRSLSASRRKDNRWMGGNSNGENLRSYAGLDNDAFQVLSTRVQEGNVMRKPPSGSRRGSRSSQIQKPTQPDTVHSSGLRERSPSPTYRLHVCNVDDEPRGFGHRKSSPSLQNTRVRSPSVDALRSIQRPYSPSFGRTARDNIGALDRQSFVVLDSESIDGPALRRNEAQRRRNDGNCNVDSQNNVPRGRPRDRAPANWMPPWYDNTNTI